MVELIEGIPVIGLTAPVVLLIVVLLVVRGGLIPRRTYDDMREFLMADRDQWRAAHAVSEAARDMQDKQILELLEQSRTTLAVVRAIAVAAGKEDSL